MSDVRISRYCECPFSAVMDFAEKTLAQRQGMLVSPGPALAENVFHTTRLVDDRTDQSRGHDALLLAWKPEHSGIFPDFRGVLTVRPMRGAPSFAYRAATIRHSALPERFSISLSDVRSQNAR